ncbi:GNAT family N-acetyltransferase [Methanobacterium sp.]|uniref:GNAT family N-acetyltransferase n=1 Tax=Methanobacterium sp. TaxID=2164 RepID=UPI0026013F60|nr:GNAT family N-acetyltransferase [Methanobacterium sp.]MDY9923905.1 GNAT family N-acetyltransferase [Methanobacterium sp.]
MPSLKTPQKVSMIKTKRLTIMPLTCDELKKHIDSPEELAKDLGLLPSQTLADENTKEVIINDLLPNIEDSNKDPLFYTMWIIIEKNKRAIVGGICFHGEPDGNGEVEIGYGTDYGYRNKGIMTETIAGLIQWLKIDNKRVKIIRAETEVDNISSVRVLEKNDFKVFQRNDDSVILKLELK